MLLWCFIFEIVIDLCNLSECRYLGSFFVFCQQTYVRCIPHHMRTDYAYHVLILFLVDVVVVVVIVVLFVICFTFCKPSVYLATDTRVAFSLLTPISKDLSISMTATKSRQLIQVSFYLVRRERDCVVVVVVVVSHRSIPTKCQSDRPAAHRILTWPRSF